MIAKHIAAELQNSSLIREMFEKGMRLRREYGADRVFDFSLGNPDLPAPPEIKEALIKAAVNNNHAYMPNAGYAELRTRIADAETATSGALVESSGVIMTVGAAGALTIALRCLLNPGDEVLILTPYFPEYVVYVKHAGGIPVIVDCESNDFMPDLTKIAAALSDKTKAILLNSPNNPSGRVYKAEILEELNRLLLSRSQAIYVLADEPYAEIVFAGLSVPSPLGIFPNCLRIYSWSKAYSLPGERIGYVALRRDCVDYENLCNGLIFLNRSLGFVNAPAIWQQVILDVGVLRCPVEAYEERLDNLLRILNESGIPCEKPDGSFYLFPKTVMADDKAFTEHLSHYNILAVPGRAFGAAGYMRLSSCVPAETIKNSEAAFKQAMADLKR